MAGPSIIHCYFHLYLSVLSKTGVLVFNDFFFKELMLMNTGISMMVFYALFQVDAFQRGDLRLILLTLIRRMLCCQEAPMLLSFLLVSCRTYLLGAEWNLALCRSIASLCLIKIRK